LKRFGEEEYHLPFFDENGYVRKMCPRCKECFWTQDPDQNLCGESTTEGCAEYTFINDPPTRERYGLRELREKFLSFFERNGHERIKPYPIVARWRDDLYFTNASIIDFQPYVTEGIIPPPANPLVISQPCVRFLDVDNVGPTFGRHLTIFEMGGHHAFNSQEKEVYWKDRTVRYHHEFARKELGVKSEEVIYKEGVWSGGGNAGPDVESIVGGLEVATLVFMKYKVVGDEYIELPIRTVDTGYGIERFTWLSQGSLSCFHAVYGEILDKIMNIANIVTVDAKLLGEISKLSGLMNLSKSVGRGEKWAYMAERVGLTQRDLHAILKPILNAFEVADHTKCIAFLLAEGVVPSNAQEGYFARLMIRRAYRLLRSLSIENKMPDIIDMQIGYWSKDFPHLREIRNHIVDILSVEQSKFEQTVSRGKSLVERKGAELKTKEVKDLPLETLVELYDSHGLPPEIVSEMAKGEGINVAVPENFYSLVADRHMRTPQMVELSGLTELDEEVKGLPETSTLYYEDQYISEFQGRVIRVLSDGRIILDKTAFYPEGGGQPSDRGYLEFNENRAKVVDVQKFGNVIVHFVEGDVPQEGMEVRGVLDWDRRISLMRHHTATHILNSAARRVLGEHVWQAGAQKDVERSRLDISHYRRLTLDEVHVIERLANCQVMKNLPVKALWVPREEAERKYGFRLYQGGVVPGREIRIVIVENWDVEADGGTHCKTTGEIGLIKIVHTERIQDGVERMIFSAGGPALETVQEEESRLHRVADLLEVPIEKVDRTVERALSDWKDIRKDRDRLIERYARLEVEKYLAMSEEISGLKLVTDVVHDAEVDEIIKIASELARLDPKVVAVFFRLDGTARVVVMVGREAQELGIKANDIAREVSSELGGGGSGRADFAQGGGAQVSNLPLALAKVEKVVREKIGGISRAAQLERD